MKLKFLLLATGVITQFAMAAPATIRDSPGASPARPAKASSYRPARSPDSARAYYQSAWGVDNFLVRLTASGNLVRFSYRATDPERARQLGDKLSSAYLVGERSHAVLSVPVMDKVGPLRQTGPAKAGQEYWMVFSNKGQLIKAGDRVAVMIGAFHADGLRVE